MDYTPNSTVVLAIFVEFTGECLGSGEAPGSLEGASQSRHSGCHAWTHAAHVLVVAHVHSGHAAVLVLALLPRVRKRRGQQRGSKMSVNTTMPLNES
jgi:hypothetical protein